MGTPLLVSADSDSKQLPDQVRARSVANMNDPAQPEGAALATLIAGSGGGASDPSLFTATATTTIAAINTWLAAGTALGVAGIKRLVGTVKITDTPLVIASGTTLDASGATITSTFVGNMLQNVNAKSTTNRDSDITIVGGTWQRNAGGPTATSVDGSASGAHSIFLRHVDRLTIRGLTVGSTGGKYMIAVGDVTNFHVSEISGATLSSDTVHITGPASNGVVEMVTVGTGGDDVVAITTTDYPGYSDVHGDVTDITIRNIKGGNTTRTVLVAGACYAAGQPDGHLLDRIVVDTVTQTGSGAAVHTGASGNTDVFGSVVISHAYGGPVLLKHPNHRSVVVIDAPRGVLPSPQDSNTVANIDSLVMRDTVVASGTAVLINSTAVAIGSLEMQNVTSAFGSLVNVLVGNLNRAALRNCRYTGTNDLVVLSGAASVTSVLLDFVTAAMKAGTHLIKLNNTAALGTATFSDCTVTAADTSSGILVNVASTTATVASVVVNRGAYTGIGRFLEKATGTSGATSLRANDCTVTGANRLAQVAGGSLDFAYSNIRLSGVVNQPIRVYNGASATIAGNGWSGYTASAAVRASTEVVRSTAADFPVDLSVLTRGNGDQATNTNSALGAGIGRAISDGTSWKNIFSGATY